MKNKFSGLSLRRDKHFVRNLVIAIGVVLVRRGVWHLADVYLLPNHPVWSSIISLIVGVLILYLPDGTLEHLGGYKKEEEKVVKKEEKKAPAGELILLQRLGGWFRTNQSMQKLIT